MLYCNKTEDTAAVSAALWALGFQDAAAAMTRLAAGGSRNQKLAASVYNQALPNTRLKRLTAKKVIL